MKSRSTCLVLVTSLAALAPAWAQEPTPVPSPETPEERIRALETRLATLEELRAADAAAIDTRVGALEETLGSVLTTALSQVKATAMVSASYTWNVHDPLSTRRNANLLRVDDPDHDSFEVTWAKIGLYRDVSNANEWDAGFRAEVAAGRQVETTLSLDPNFNGGTGRTFNLAQAFVVLQAPTPFGKPVAITGGRFYGWFGIESLDVPTNPNFSLSYFSNFTPFTNTGVGIGMDLVDGLRYTQYVVNGWDLVVDNNDAKSYGGQLTLTLKDPATTIAFNWLAGKEQLNDEEDLRWLVELDVITKLTETTELRLAFHYGQEEDGAVAPETGVAKYGGAQAILRQEFYEVRAGFRRFAVAVRGGFWRDQGGSKSGKEQTLTDTTATFEVRFTEFASLRLEWRHDHTNTPYFLGSRATGSQHHQDTASVELNLRF